MTASHNLINLILKARIGLAVIFLLGMVFGVLLGFPINIAFAQISSTAITIPFTTAPPPQPIEEQIRQNPVQQEPTSRLKEAVILLNQAKQMAITPTSVSTIRKLINDSLAIQIEVLGNGQLDVGKTFHLLGNFEYYYGIPEEAIGYYQKAYVIYSSMRGDKKQLSLLIGDLAYYYEHTKRSGQARELYPMALLMQRQYLGDNSLRLFVTLIDYANIIINDNALDKAENLLREAESIQNNIENYYKRLSANNLNPEKVKGQDILALKLAFARLYMAKGEHLKANQLLIESHAKIIELEPLDQNPQTLENDLNSPKSFLIGSELKQNLENPAIYENLERNVILYIGKNYVKSDDLINAKAWLEPSIKDINTELASSPPNIILMQFNWQMKQLLASVYIQEANYDEANILLTSIIDESIQKEGKENLLVSLSALKQIIFIDLIQGNQKEALENANLYIEKMDTLSIENSGLYAKGILNLAEIMKNGGEFAAARELYMKAQASLIKILPADDPQMRLIQFQMADMEGKVAWPENQPVELENILLNLETNLASDQNVISYPDSSFIEILPKIVPPKSFEDVILKDDDALLPPPIAKDKQAIIPLPLPKIIKENEEVKAKPVETPKSHLLLEYPPS